MFGIEEPKLMLWHTQHTFTLCRETQTKTVPHWNVHIINKLCDVLCCILRPYSYYVMLAPAARNSSNEILSVRRICIFELLKQSSVLSICAACQWLSVCVCLLPSVKCFRFRCYIDKKKKNIQKWLVATGRTHSDNRAITTAKSHAHTHTRMYASCWN